jgi:nucleoside-diphosphate-sugar epimerase
MNVPQTHYDEVNVGGTRIVLEESVNAGVRRVVYCSTCGVHGNVDNPPADEDAPIQPADYYQRSKYLAEPIVADYAAKGLIETITLRPAAIYGPGDLERFAMIYRQVAKGWFPIFGNGKAFYHPSYVDNLVDAFVLSQAADRNAVNGKAFLIADEEYLTTEDLVQRVANALGIAVKIRRFPLLPMRILGHVCEIMCRPFGIAPPIFPRRVDWYRQNRAFSTKRAETFLGYKPRISIDEGLRRTGEWYRAEGIIAAGSSIPVRSTGTMTEPGKNGSQNTTPHHNRKKPVKA